MQERLEKIPQKAADIILDLAHRPLRIRRERHEDKIIYTDLKGEFKPIIVDTKKTS